MKPLNPHLLEMISGSVCSGCNTGTLFHLKSLLQKSAAICSHSCQKQQILSGIVEEGGPVILCRHLLSHAPFAESNYPVVVAVWQQSCVRRALCAMFWDYEELTVMSKPNNDYQIISAADILLNDITPTTD